jgi:hypothetical protein
MLGHPHDAWAEAAEVSMSRGTIAGFALMREESRAHACCRAYKRGSTLP